MSRFVYSSILLAVLCLFCGTVVAQNPPLTTCVAATGVTPDLTQIAGNWYEVARLPAPSNTSACVQINIATVNQALVINATFATDMKKLWQNQTASGSLPLTSTINTNSYTIAFSVNNTTLTPVTYKFLSISNSVIYMCGYTNPGDTSTSFGYILSRERFLNNTILTQYEQALAPTFANFNGTMAAITQNKYCVGNSATTHVPILAAIFAAIYAMFKLIH